jgi:hypothetical protein
MADPDENLHKNEPDLKREAQGSKRASIRVRWGGDSFHTIEGRPLYFDDSVADDDIPLLESRFGSSKNDSSPTRPGRFDERSQNAPKRPSRPSYDDWSDDESYHSGDELAADRSHKGRRHSDPDVWVIPADDDAPSASETNMWRVKRVWGIDGIDEREEEYKVDDKDLINRVKTLLGVPMASWVFGNGAEYDATSSEWKINKVYDVDGAIYSSGKTQLLNEDALLESFTGVMSQQKGDITVHPLTSDSGHHLKQINESVGQVIKEKAVDKVKTLLGVPTLASWVFGDGDEYDNTASEWKVKVAYDVDEEARSSGNTQLLNEDGLLNYFTGGMNEPESDDETAASKKSPMPSDATETENQVARKLKDGYSTPPQPAIGKGKESELLTGDSNASNAGDEKNNTPKESVESQVNPSKSTSAQGESKEKKKKKKKEVEEESSIFDLLTGGPKVTTVSYSYNYG